MSKNDAASDCKQLFIFIQISQSTQELVHDTLNNTLASRGLEELFLQLCCCVSFWFWQGIGFGFTYLCTQSIQYSCGVVLVFDSGGNQFLCYVSTQCMIQLCGCVSFFVMAGNSTQNENTSLQKNLIGLLFYDPLANVCFL